MDSEQRHAVIAMLKESRAALCLAVADVAPEQANIRSGADAWSVLDILEHVALAENGMFGMLRKATPVEASLENRDREAALAAQAGSRASKGAAPSRVHPKGRFLNLEDALAQFVAAREQTIRFAAETTGDLHRLCVTHPLFGPVNGYELLLIMAGHARRHARQVSDQIAELRSK